MLTPKGRVTDHLKLVRTSDTVYADVEPSRAALLKQFFDERVFITRVEISDVSEELGLIEVFGPDSGEAVKAVEGSLAVVPLERPLPGAVIWAPRGYIEAISSALRSHGVAPSSAEDLEEVRVIEGSPRIGIDYGDHHLPQEAALEYLVHFAKGCYLGQEAVAMAQRGTVKRRLRHLHFEGEALTGRVLYENDEAGTATSAAKIVGVSRGIATIKTSVPIDARVTVVSDESRSDAVVKALPGTIDGPELPSARELRERLQGSKT